MSGEVLEPHSLGVICGLCKAPLKPDNCCPGQPHGHGYQRPSEWAARTWPEHVCFTIPTVTRESAGSETDHG